MRDEAIMRALHEVPIPAPDAAEARGQAVVEAAFAEREPPARRAASKTAGRCRAWRSPSAS